MDRSTYILILTSKDVHGSSIKVIINDRLSIVMCSTILSQKLGDIW